MKRLFLSFILIALITLSGCVQELRTKEEDSDAIAEYMAGLLLKYNDYESTLLPLKELEDSFEDDDYDNQTDNTTNSDNQSDNTTNNDKKDDSTNTASSGKNTDDKSENVQTISFKDIMGQKNFDISYSAYILTENYPEDYDNTYISVLADEGKQLLVIKFKIKNTTKKAAKLDLGEASVKYSLTVGNTKLDKPWFTVLENDLQYFDMDIKAEATTEAVLVFQISKEADTSAMKLTVSKDGKEAVIPLKK